jgi:glycosyltransferase involved in cell wall biosynthesis
MCLRNEQEKIRETLAQVIAITDELVVGIDETSNDDTERIIEQYKDKVGKLTIYHYKFENDFSKMRNECMAKATQDWILMIDGHDYVTPESVAIVDQIANRLPEDRKHVRVIDAVMEDPPDPRTGTRNAYQRPVMFRRVYKEAGKEKHAGIDGVKWSLPIHNIIEQPRQFRLCVGDFVLEHRQPKERQEVRKSQRKTMNTKGLLKQVEADPTDTRSLFYLARTYDELEEWDKAIEWFYKYLEISAFPEERYQARLQIAAIHIKRYEKDQNRAHLDKAMPELFQCQMERVPRNDHMILAGDVCRTLQIWDEASLYYRQAMQYVQPKMFLFIVRENYTWIPLERLAVCLAQMGRYSQAIGSLRMAIAHRPGHQEYYNLLAKLEQHENMEFARHGRRENQSPAI